MSGPTKTRREVLIGACAALALPSVLVTSTATVKPDTFGAAYPPGWMDKVEYEGIDHLERAPTALRVHA